MFTTFRKKLSFIVKSLLRFSLVMLHQKIQNKTLVGVFYNIFSTNCMMQPKWQPSIRKFAQIYGLLKPPKKSLHFYFIFSLFEKHLWVKIKNGHGSIEKFRILPIFWWHAKTYCPNMVTSQFLNPHNVKAWAPLFPRKGPFYHSHLHYFCHLNMKIHPPKNKLNTTHNFKKLWRLNGCNWFVVFDSSFFLNDHHFKCSFKTFCGMSSPPSVPCMHSNKSQAYTPNMIHKNWNIFFLN